MIEQPGADVGNPSAVRVANDGRVAASVIDSEGQVRWIRVFAPDGMLRVEALTGDDVTDWREVHQA